MAMFFQDYALAQFCINPGSSVTIKHGTSLYLGTDLLIRSTAGGSGYLVDQGLPGAVQLTGSLVVERYVGQSGWHNIAAPVGNAHSSLFSGTDLFFYYDETIVQNDWNFGWVWYSGPLSALHGYDVFLDNNPITVAYTSTNPNHLNTGPFSASVSLTNAPDGEIPQHKGWNLLGNPYPSPVDWLSPAGWDKTAINDAKYIWDPANEVYTIFVGGSNPIGINGGTRFIPSNQGFWVQATANGMLQVNNAVRVGQTLNTPEYYKKDENTYPVLRLTASGNGYSDESVVRFLDGTHPGFDRDFDALKIFGKNAKVPQLGSLAEGMILSVNTLGEMSEGLTLPLYFYVGTDGLYEIQMSSNLIGMDCYIFDIVTDRLVRIDDYTPYHFIHKPSYPNNRFTLVFDPDINQLAAMGKLFTVFACNGNITILNSHEKPVTVTVTIHDMIGRLMRSEQLFLASTYTFYPGLQRGYYVVSLVAGESASRHKLYIE